MSADPTPSSAGLPAALEAAAVEAAAEVPIFAGGRFRILLSPSDLESLVRAVLPLGLAHERERIQKLLTIAAEADPVFGFALEALTDRLPQGKP